MVAVVIAAAPVAGCATDSGARPDAVVVGYAGDPVRRAAAAVYAAAIPGARLADAPAEDGEQLDRLLRGETDVLATYSGPLLARLEPASPATTEDEVYAELFRALPPGVTVGVEGTVGADPGAPEATPVRALLPVVRTARLDKALFQRLSAVSSVLTRTALAELARAVEAGSDVREAARSWVEENVRTS